MPKGNPQPTNNVRLSLTSELMDFLDTIPNKKGIPKGFKILQGFLKHHKKAFIAIFGKDVYEDHITRYNRSRTEMHREKLERERERLQRLKERKELKERELRIKEKELEIREENQELRREKLEGDNPSEIKRLINTITTSKGIARTTALRRLRELDPEKASELEKVLEE